MIIFIRFININRTIKKLFPGTEILQASDGNEGLDICNELVREGKDVKLMITDFHMPNMSEEQLISRMKLHFPDSKVIAYTADARSEATISLGNAGANAVLIKPDGVY